MAKRGATSDLNHDNWNDEEEPEEAGVFVQATTDVLQSRTIKKAKRRVLEENGSESKKGAFSGFGGLGSTGNSESSSNAFSTFNKGSTSGMFGSAKPASTSIFSGASSSMNGSDEQKSNIKKDQEGDSQTATSSKDSSYFSFLKSLNESVLAWIRQHVEENPYIILTPIFRDYEKYLEKHAPAKSTVASSTFGPSSAALNSFSSTPSVKPSAASVDKSDNKSDETEETTAKPTPSFSFGQSESSLKEETSDKAEDKKASGFAEQAKVSFATSSGGNSSSQKGFTFGLTSTGGTGGFSFGLSKASSDSTTTAPAFGKSGFSFGSSSTATSFSFGLAAGSSTGATSAVSDTKDAADEEEYVPPKPEVKEIKEDDAIYSKRCKLYFQRDEQWVDRGVGNIHLKPVADDKTQILIRADTNLGNILLNVMLSTSMPVSRQGKNNVFLVCVPNPPISSKKGEGEDAEEGRPVPMLVRVKTGEDADELFANIEERKKLLESS